MRARRLEKTPGVFAYVEVFSAKNDADACRSFAAIEGHDSRQTSRHSPSLDDWSAILPWRTQVQHHRARANVAHIETRHSRAPDQLSPCHTIFASHTAVMSMPANRLMITKTSPKTNAQSPNVDFRSEVAMWRSSRATFLTLLWNHTEKRSPTRGIVPSMPLSAILTLMRTSTIFGACN
jgi:hypothetical protein